MPCRVLTIKRTVSLHARRRSQFRVCRLPPEVTMARLVSPLALSIALTFFLLPALVSRTAAAASPRDTLVVSATWLAQHLKDPDLVLLHVGGKDGFAAAHIPGAQRIG